MIVTLPCIYIYEILVHTKMSLNRFETNSLIYSHNTRNKFDLFVTGHNNKLFENSFTHSGVLIFNRLPSEITNIQAIMRYKKILSNLI